MRLPLSRTGHPPTPSAADVPEETPRGPSRRILVIDDNRDAADTMAMLLRVLGHEVRTAYDGPTALDLARLNPPEVVLCDISMPGMSGLEVARRLRHDLGLRDTLIVAVTGYGQEEDKRRSRQADFDAHLIKPASLEALQALLARGTSLTPRASLKGTDAFAEPPDVPSTPISRPSGKAAFSAAGFPARPVSRSGPGGARRAHPGRRNNTGFAGTAGKR